MLRRLSSGHSGIPRPATTYQDYFTFVTTDLSPNQSTFQRNVTPGVKSREQGEGSGKSTRDCLQRGGYDGLRSVLGACPSVMVLVRT